MNLRKSIASTVVAGTILLSTVVTGAAQQASINITPGGFSYSVVEAGFPNATFSFDEQTVAGGKIVLKVVDQTGDMAGWKITVAPSNFVGPAGTTPIPFSNMALTNSTPTRNAGMNTTGITATYPGNLTWTAASGSGSGDYNLTTQASLKVPGQTKVGQYKSTLTVTAVDNTP